MRNFAPHDPTTRAALSDEALVVSSKLAALFRPLGDVIVEQPAPPVRDVIADLRASLEKSPQLFRCPACGDLGKRDRIHDRFCETCADEATELHEESPAPESLELDEDGESQNPIEAVEDILHTRVGARVRALRLAAEAAAIVERADDEGAIR